MGLILHKGSSTNSGQHISIVTVGDIWFECDDVKITKIENNHFCNSNTVYVILQKMHMMEKFKGHWACPNGCRLLIELMRRHQNSILNRFLLKTSFHALLTFIYFCYFLFFGLCLLLLLVSLDIDPVLFVLDLHMKYTVQVVFLLRYIVWFVIV